MLREIAVDIAVIGAGISGLLTALQLSKNRRVNSIKVYEKRALNAVPRKHCSGIVSKDTLLNIPYAFKFVENSYSYVNILVDKGFEIEFVFEKNAIHRIDRISHEKYLLETIKNRGVDVSFSSEVTNVEISSKGYTVRSLGGVADTYNAVVIAEGYPPRLALKLGLKAYATPLNGIQRDVYLEKKLKLEDLDKLYVHIDLNENEIAWFIPINERKAVIGIATVYTASTRLYSYEKLFLRRLGVEAARVLDIYGGIVLRGYPVKIMNKNILCLGDAVATVKSFSGGGLYPISTISKIYGENIHQLDVTKHKIGTVTAELKKQFKLYSAIRAFSNVIPFNKKLLSLRRISVEVKDSSLYDHHEIMLVKMITSIAFRQSRIP